MSSCPRTRGRSSALERRRAASRRISIASCTDPPTTSTLTEEDWKVWPGSNRHVGLVVANYGASIELDFLNEDDEARELEAALEAIDLPLGPL